MKKLHTCILAIALAGVLVFATHGSAYIVIRKYDDGSYAVSDDFTKVDASEEPSSGEFLDYDAREVYYYDSATRTFTKLRDWSGSTQTSGDQAGECEYILGSWESSSSGYTYGTCISFAISGDSNGDGRHWYDYRFDSRNLTDNPKNVFIDFIFLDANGTEIDLGEAEAHRTVQINCKTEIDTVSREIKECHFQDKKALPEDRIHELAPSAAWYCGTMSLYEYYDQASHLVHTVDGGCHPV